MKAKVRLFARLSELAGTRVAEVEVGEGLAVEDVYQALCAKYPSLSGLNGSLRYAVNGEYAEPGHPVGGGGRGGADSAGERRVACCLR